jgi:bacillithiol synthase
MTLRIVDTPLDGDVEVPAAREGGFPAGLLEACIRAPGTEAAIGRLREPGALVVTTGQQPALFGGPLYSVHKALSAAALARVLERRWERPVVPLFWSAGDDHDFAEANHASWLDRDGRVRTWTLRSRAPDAPLLPMYREPLGPEVEDALAAIEADLLPSEFGAETIAWLRRHYQPGATVSASYAGALAELLAPAGVVVFDSTHRSVKRAAARHLVRALGLAQDLDRDLARQARALQEIGRDAGVGVGDGAALVMLEGRLGRDRLVVEGPGFITRRSRERFDHAALQQIAAAEPERLSANVLLRPVIESALLPTVAYVAGPGELRYLALTPPIYDRMRVHRQQPVPRWSGLLVDARVERVLAKFSISLDELLQPAGGLESRLVRSQMPDDATAALARLQATLEAEYERIRQAATAIDPTLERTVDGARRRAADGARDIEQRMIRHLKRRQAVELGQIERARAVVRPDGKPQERVLVPAGMLARHGAGMISALSDTIHDWYARALEGHLVAP